MDFRQRLPPAHALHTVRHISRSSMPISDKPKPYRSSDRREYRRVPAAHLDWVSWCSLRHGPSSSLIDLSPGGAQITTEHQLKPGRTEVIRLYSSDSTIALPSRVVRAEIIALVPRLL